MPGFTGVGTTGLVGNNGSSGEPNLGFLPTGPYVLFPELGGGGPGDAGGAGGESAGLGPSGMSSSSTGIMAWIHWW